MENIEENMMSFIDRTPNAYYSVNNIKDILLANDFTELYENKEWEKLENNGNYFVIRNDSSLIAFKVNKNSNGFNIVAAHGDSPSFSIKPNPDIFENSYLKLNTSGYGGMINYSWLDRPLSISGRVITKKDGIYRSELINIDKDLLIIPSQAIHINRDVNSKNELNPQADMLPIMALSNDKKLEDIIKDNLSNDIGKICDYDLYLYNRDKSRFMGLNNELILGPRLDDLASLYSSVIGFIESDNNDSINVLCSFNNEEIGSLTREGADSTFLNDILTRIANNLDMNIYTSLSNSMMVSADNAHAIHPNASYKSDPTNKVLLNNGIVIKHHTNYTTDGLTSSIFKDICESADVPYQDFACRSDMRCGATLGGISGSHVSINSVDIGVPQLAMHSANETMGTKDVLYMYKAILEFYNSTIIKEKNKIKILHK